MLKYLIILLNDNAVSYCHYDANIGPDTSISPEILSKAIFWAMKENLSVQFVYSNENLSNELKELIDSIEDLSTLRKEFYFEIVQSRYEKLIKEPYKMLAASERSNE